MLPGRKSGFRAGFRPDSDKEDLKIGPPAGRRPAGGPIGSFPDKNPAEIQPESSISGPEARLHNIGYDTALNTMSIMFSFQHCEQGDRKTHHLWEGILSWSPQTQTFEEQETGARR
jgi:hypothetical protein